MKRKKSARKAGAHKARAHEKSAADPRKALRQTARRLRELEIEVRKARDEAEQAHGETREALEQQKAASEVLHAISSSIADTSPVFEAILTNASRLCDASFAAVFLYDGEFVRSVAHQSASVEFARYLKNTPARPSRETTTRRCALERRTVHTPDLLNDPEFDPPQAQRRENVRTSLSVPMMREGVLVGVISLWRSEVRPFSDKQIALVQTFADQAVIAIENVRLYNETREALEQQKAAAEVLRVISSSIADTAPVFEAIVQAGIRLFEGAAVAVTRPEEGEVRLMAIAERDPEQADKWRQRFPFPCSRDYMHGAALLDCTMVDVPDIEALSGRFEAGKRNFVPAGYRAMTVVPMVKEGAAIGAISVIRRVPGPLAAKQIALLRTFADQAVIAIENARLFAEIQEKSRQLEVASRHKSQFLANMSHELRTPLNAIIGFTRLVMRHSQGVLEAKQYENLEKIQAGGQQLLSLINSVLDLSKIEAGRVEVRAAEIGLAPVLEQCARTIEPLVKADAVALLREFNGELPALYADEEKLRQIVLNLLSNAAKFTPRGSIRLRAQAAGDGVAIAVADTGIGIPADKLELIFEEFEQAHAGINRAHGGTGLGLAIARRLARLMGGDIDVLSQPGSGSTFTLRLPLRYAA